MARGLLSEEEASVERAPDIGVTVAQAECTEAPRPIIESVDEAEDQALPYLDVDALKKLCEPLFRESPRKKRGQPAPPGFIARPTNLPGWRELALRNGLINEQQANAKHKRPDVSAKRASGKKSQEFCRQVTLGALLNALPCATNARIQRLRDMIDSSVERISRIMVQRSHLIAAYLTDKLDHTVVVPNDASPDAVDPKNDCEQALVETGQEEPLDDADMEKQSESESDCEEAPAETDQEPPLDDNDDADEGLPDLFGTKSSFLRRCFTVGVGDFTSKHAGLKAKLEEWADAFPTLHSPPHVGNAMTHAANLYRTNLQNHLVLYANMRDRLRRYVMSRLYGPLYLPTVHELEQDAPDEESGEQVTTPDQRKLAGKKVDDTVKLVLEGFSEPIAEEVGHEAASLARDIRTALNLQGDARKLTEKHLKDNYWCVLALIKTIDRHYHAERVQMAELREQAGQQVRFRRFAGVGLQLVPLHHKRRAMCIKLDLSDWTRLLAKADLLGVTSCVKEDLYKDLAREHLEHAVRKLLRIKDARHFTGTIDTDGVTACIHMREMMTKEELDARAATKARKFRTREQIAKDAKADAEARKNRKARPLPRVSIMVDKGRVRLLHCAVFVDGAPLMVCKASKHPTVRDAERKPTQLQFALSSGAYYTQSGVRRRMRVVRDSRRRVGLEAADRAMAEAAIGLGARKRSTELNDVLARARALIPAQDTAWVFAMRRKVRNMKFRNKVGKERMVHTFFASIKNALRGKHGLADKDVDEAVMVFGDAKFGAGGKGNAPVPVTSVEHMARRHFKVERCSEFRTSKACPKCADCRPKQPSQLGEVRMRAPAGGRIATVRHAWWAPMRSVRHNMYKGGHTGRLLRRMRKQSGVGVNQSPTLAACGNFALRRTRASKYVYDWRYDGHGMQSNVEKKDAKKKRIKDGCIARYVRGLRYCQVCKGVMDRDQCGAHGIFHHYLSELDPKKALPLVYQRSYNMKTVVKDEVQP